MGRPRAAGLLYPRAALFGMRREASLGTVELSPGYLEDRKKQSSVPGGLPRRGATWRGSEVSASAKAVCRGLAHNDRARPTWGSGAEAPTWSGVFLAQQWELVHLVCIMLPPFASVTLSRSSFVTGILPPCSASRALGWAWPSLMACLGRWELICCWPTAACTEWEGSGRGAALWLPGPGGQCLPPASSVPGPSPGAR